MYNLNFHCCIELTKSEKNQGPAETGEVMLLDFLRKVLKLNYTFSIQHRIGLNITIWVLPKNLGIKVKNVK